MSDDQNETTPADIVLRLRAVDHMSVEDCFLQSHLFAAAAREIERLRGAILTAFAAPLPPGNYTATGGVAFLPLAEAMKLRGAANV